jgi:hypothetical protein
MRNRWTVPVIRSESGSSEAAMNRRLLCALAFFGLLGCRDAAVQARPQTMDKSDIHWSSPVNGLRLGVGGNGGFAELSLENTGTTPLLVLSHVNAGETHLDWFSLHLRDSHGAVRDLHLFADRDKSAEVKVTLAPGQRVNHRVDLQSWAARPSNGAAALREGAYELSATYEVDAGAHWSGKLEAGPVKVAVAGVKAK